MTVITAIPTALGHTAATATTTAGTLASIPSGATHARIDVATGGGNLVYTIDGTTTPTATLGEVIPAGQAGEIALGPTASHPSASLADVKLRSDTGTAAFSVSYRKYG